MDDQSMARRALRWAREHKGVVLAGSALALPLVARYVPGFPVTEAMAVLRMLLGA